ncbi:MAG: hypothetical protein JWQ43_3948 [Glaciihabitans sp.]|nr:hypothetical protein [Glaciihabitans sp.]
MSARRGAGTRNSSKQGGTKRDSGATGVTATGRQAAGRTRTAIQSSTAVASEVSSATVGLRNARTRLVGTRTGFLADTLIVLARMARAVRGFLRRVAIRSAAVVTPVGWVLAALVPLSLSIGYSIGWLELVIVGWAGLVLLGLAALYLIGGSALIIDLRMVSPRVVVGQPADGEIAVQNPRRARLLGGTVEIPVGDGLVDVELPSLARTDRFVSSFSVPTIRRGVVVVGPVRSVRADPIGLVRREMVWTDRREIFVHPRTIPIPSMSTGLVRDLEGNATRELTTSDMSFHALREYQPGDERRSIHWKSTARTGTYMVRQFEQTRRSHLLIALSLAEADFASEDEFEMAVSVAGSLGARAIRDTRDVTVVVSETTPDFAARKLFAIRSLSTLTRSRLLDGLALVERETTALGLVDVARVTAERVTGVSVAFLVCGSVVTPALLRAASAKFAAGVEVVAIVCDPEHQPGLRRVGGLTVITIGFLDDLQKSLAASAAA